MHCEHGISCRKLKFVKVNSVQQVLSVSEVLKRAVIGSVAGMTIGTIAVATGCNVM